MPKTKNIKKRNYRKITEKVKKLDITGATNEQLENLLNSQHIKYAMSLEDQLQEDKAHLLLKKFYKKYNGQLPENNKFDFEQKHTLTEAGTVKHQYKLKAKKKVQND